MVKVVRIRSIMMLTGIDVKMYRQGFRGAGFKVSGGAGRCRRNSAAPQTHEAGPVPFRLQTLAHLALEPARILTHACGDETVQAPLGKVVVFQSSALLKLCETREPEAKRCVETEVTQVGALSDTESACLPIALDQRLLKFGNLIAFGIDAPVIECHGKIEKKRGSRSMMEIYNRREPVSFKERVVVKQVAMHHADRQALHILA